MPIQAVIHVPVSQALASTTNIFAGVPNSVPYYWSDFVSDITATFAKFTNVATTHASVSILMLYDSSPPWHLKTFPVLMGQAGGGAPPVTSVPGVLVWDNRPSLVPSLDQFEGPTGNNVNDVTFLRLNHVGGGGGLCSMLVDPATGVITEADLLFDLASFAPPTTTIQGLLPMSGQPWNPRETTSYAHEVGHFFGLDHTNLHRGNASIGGSVTPCTPGINPTPVLGFPPSLSSCYTPDSVPPSNRHQPIVLSEYPAMSGAVITGGGSNHVTAPLHDDDAVAMSMLYPVTQLTGCPSPKIPLINTSAVFRGHIVLPSGQPAYGVNVIPTLHFAGSSTIVAWLPATGTVSGFFRLTASEVIGVRDPTTAASCSGAFNCEGVPIRVIGGMQAPLAAGTAYDIALEPTESAGISAGWSAGAGASTFTFSEWVEDNLLNPAPFNSWTSTTFTTGWVANESNGPVRSIEVAPGSIIDVTLVHNGTITVEPATRPLVQMTPRDCRPPAAMTVTVISNFQLLPASISLTVNGVPIPNLPGYHVPPNPASYPP
jgi:hypothetical protein